MNGIVSISNLSQPGRNGALPIGITERRRLGVYGPGDPRPVEKNGTEAAAESLASGQEVKTQWMDVTPAMAAAWLKNNFRNRPMREDTWKAYARDMLNEIWVPTHQGVAFNDRDELIDGQHRLKAIVETGCTVRMMVTFGLPSKIPDREMTTMDAVDRGATRSVGDQLTIQHGMKNGSITASLCASLASLCFGERTRRLSVGQTLEVYRTFEEAATYVIEHRSKDRGLKSCGVLAGFAFALATEKGYLEGETEVSRLFNRLNLGEGLEAGSAMKVLREFLTSDQAALFMRSLDRGLAELTLQAIWLELNGRKAEKLEQGLEGVAHFRELLAPQVSKVAALFKLPEKQKPTAADIAPAPESSAAPAERKRPSLSKILEAVEGYFKIGKAIIVGKGTDPDIVFPRAAFVSLAMSFEYEPGALALVLRRSAGQVMELHWPKKQMGPRQLRVMADLRAKLAV